MAKWQKVIDVNLTGTFLGMQASVEAMKAAGGGSIINVSSIEGMRGAVDGASVRGVQVGGARPDQVRGDGTRRAARSGSTRSIPGFIRTPMTKHFPDDMLTIPLGRPGQSDEVATFVVFLASDESPYATGAEFVDGRRAGHRRSAQDLTDGVAPPTCGPEMRRSAGGPSARERSPAGSIRTGRRCRLNGVGTSS